MSPVGGTSVLRNEVRRLPRLPETTEELHALASHWPVSSAATAALMRRFVTHWRSGAAADSGEALVAAMRELLHDSGGQLAHPMYYWAPFLVFGNESESATALHNLSFSEGNP